MHAKTQSFFRLPFFFALVFALIGSGLIFVSVPASQAVAPATINLGSSANFGVIAGTYISTGATNRITGDLGAGTYITTGATNTITGNLHAGAAITNGAGTTVSGTQAHTQAGLASTFGSAMTDLDAAILDAETRPVLETVTALGGDSTLLPGVYSAAGAFLTLTGTLTLDARGDSNAVFIIRSPTYLESAAGSRVLLANGARASNVFFLTGTHMILGANTILKGNILATDYVSFGADVEVQGHIFSKASYVIFGAGTTTTRPPLNLALTPAIGGATATADGFTATITNYDSIYTWSATVTSGSVALSSSGVLTVTGVASNTSARATITSARAGSETGSQSVTGTSLSATELSPARTPAIGFVIATASGFTATIANYDSSYTWGASATSGLIVISNTGLITVTGVAANTAVIKTVTSSKTGSETGSRSVTTTSLWSALTPTLGSVVSTATGFRTTITNYDSSYTWSAAANAGSVDISNTGVITVSGLAANTLTTATITSSKNGSETGSHIVTGTSLDSVSIPTPPRATLSPEQKLPTVTPAPRVRPVVPVTMVTEPVGTIAGSNDKVTIVANGPREKLIASSGAWKVDIKAELLGGQSKPISENLTLDFQLGSMVVLSGTGLHAKAKVSVYVFSGPTFIGEIETLADGSFATSTLLPASILPGNHTLQLLTTDLDGRQIVLNIPITVSGKVTVGTFKGHLALYTKDLMGQKLSARIAGKWLVQDPIAQYKNFNYSRQIRFVGVGYKVSVDLYLNSSFFRTDVITIR